jgi:hypothetical protein
MTPTFIDPLEWYRKDYRDALMRADEKQQELANIFDLFANNQKRDRDAAIDYLQRGQALAKERNSPFWELLFDYWHYTLTTRGSGDVDKIVRLFIKANQAPYRDCPIIGRIYAAVIDAYVWTDPISYATEIREAISYTSETIPISQATYQRILLAKVRMEYELQEYEAITRTAKTLIKYAEHNRHDTITAYLTLAKAHLLLEDYKEAIANATSAHHLAASEGLHDLQRSALTIQSTACIRQNDRIGADIARSKLRELDWQGAKLLDIAFDAELDYWWHHSGWFGKFTGVHFTKQIVDYYVNHDYAQPYWECRARFKMIQAILNLPWFLRLLVQLFVGAPSLKQLVQEAELASENLTKPEWYRDRLHRIAWRYMDKD